MHGNFRAAIAELAREVENFGVESETVDFLPRENRARRFAPHQFESALRVEEGKSRDQAHHQVEKTSGVFAQRRLMASHELRTQSARADHYVETLECFIEQRVNVFDRRGKIGVGKQDPL